ncbi:MAG: hypothetical protein V4667_01215 [Bacteroidota bacterium]
MTVTNSKYNWIASLLIAISILIAYSNHYHNTFHFDDSHTVQNNSYIRDIKNIPLFFQDASTFSTLPTNQSYRPIVSTTLAIDFWVGDSLDPFWFQVSATIWHIALCILIYFLFVKLNTFTIDKSKQKLIALFATLIFAVHPAGAETVNYIIQRGDLQSAFFVVLAMILYLYSEKSRKYYLYLLIAFIGCLAKITTIMFIPILLIYIFLFEKNNSLLDFFKYRKLKTIIPISILTLLVGALIYLFIRKMEPETWVSGGTSKYLYLITQPYVIALYTISFFVPIHLSADTDLLVFESILNAKAIFGLLFLMTLVFVMFWSSTKQNLKGITFGIAWYLLCLLPTSSIIPFSEVMNDHRVFLPYIGLCIAVIHTLYFLFENAKKYFVSVKDYEKSIITFFVVVILSFTYGTYQRNKVWLSDESLWFDVVNKSPNNGRGQMNYGLTQMAKGNYDEAERRFLKGLQFIPNYSYLHVNLGVLYSSTNRVQLAEKHFLKGLEFAGNNPNPCFFYGRFLFRQNRLLESESYLKKAIQISSGYIEARHFLMDVYYKQNKTKELKELFTSTLVLNQQDMKALYYSNLVYSGKSQTELLQENVVRTPTYEGFIDLSLQYYQSNNFIKSIEAAEQALKINPKSSKALNNIGAAYGAMMVWEKQIEYCSKALEIEPNFEVAKNNVVWAKQQIEIIKHKKK